MKIRIDLERYNQIVWAVIGSGVVVLALIALIGFLVALWPTGQTGVPVEVVRDPGQPQSVAHVRADPCLPVPIPGTPYQLIGVSMERIVVGGTPLATRVDKKFGSVDSYEAPVGCGYPGSGGISVAGGVLIRDTRSGALRSLLPQGALIGHMEYRVPPKNADDRELEEAFPPEGILYWEIASGDTNRDGVLNSEDDMGAYLSDVDGSKLTRITPPLSRVVEKTYDADRKILTIKLMPVVDNDATRNLDTASIIEVSVPQRRLIGTVIESQNWQQLLDRAKPINELP